MGPFTSLPLIECVDAVCAAYVHAQCTDAAADEDKRFSSQQRCACTQSPCMELLYGSSVTSHKYNGNDATFRQTSGST